MLRVLPPALALVALVSSGPRAQPPREEPLTLELRVFLGQAEVTPETRVTVHRAGDRGSPVAQLTPRNGPLEVRVPAGIYDAQAIRVVDGKVVNIRWAERLVVMPYPDEGGRHLEVINFTAGYGALEIRASGGRPLPELALYRSGQHAQPAGTRVEGSGYALFVVPAGSYDVQVRSGAKADWHAAIEVPSDRTRLWPVPEAASK